MPIFNWSKGRPPNLTEEQVLSQNVKDLEKDLKAAENKNGSLKRHAHELQQTISELKNEVSRNARDLSKVEGLKQDLKAAETTNESLERHVQKLRQKINKLEDEVSRSAQDLSAALSANERLQIEHQNAIDRLQREQEAKLSQLTRDYETSIEKREEEHSDQVHQLTDSLEKRKKEHDDQVYQLTDSLEKRKREYSDQVYQLTNSHSLEHQRLLKEHKAKTEQLSKEHKAKTDRLLKDADAYSTALLARDDFKPTSDAELKAQFLEFAQDIDAFARLGWKADDQARGEWPALSSLLSGRVKKCILQNTIWAILNEYVFCSPFRMFGEEGRELEAEWNEQCGKDLRQDNGFYNWPPPKMETERWRYMTVKEGRSALVRPLPSQYDPRAKLKLGFVSSRNDLIMKSKSTLQEIAYLGESDVETIGVLARKAAKLWLDFAMQRCRILIFIPKTEPTSIPARISAAQTGSMSLVVRPELRRIGNSKGLNLSDGPVSICPAEMVEVYNGNIVGDE